MPRRYYEGEILGGYWILRTLRLDFPENLRTFREALLERIIDIPDASNTKEGGLFPEAELRKSLQIIKERLTKQLAQ